MHNTDTEIHKQFNMKTDTVIIIVRHDLIEMLASALAQLIFRVHPGWHGQRFFARVGLRNYTGKSRCIPTLRRDTSGLTHASRILSCDTALDFPAGDPMIFGDLF